MFPERDKREENTEAYLKMLRNPYLDILGHADDSTVPCDFEAMVRTAGEEGKLLELNNNSITAHRPGSLPSLKKYILCCKAPAGRGSASPATPTFIPWWAAWSP